MQIRGSKKRGVRFPHMENWMQTGSRDLLKRFWEYRSLLRRKAESVNSSIFTGIKKPVGIKVRPKAKYEAAKRKIPK